VVAERDLTDLHLKLKQASYWLSAEGELQVDANLKLSLRQILEGMTRAEGRFLALSEGRFVALTQRLKQELEDLSVLSQQRNGQVELHPLALGVIHGWGAVVENVSFDARSAESLSRLRQAAEMEVVPPPTLQAELRPYQLDGFVWLSRLAHMNAGACLADDMGLGKTLQALALILAHAKQGPALVVAPTSVTANWAEEAARFAPTLRILRFAGEGREKLVSELRAGDLLISSYGMMQQGIELLETQEFSLVVLDEAQAIKNPSTQRAKTSLRLKARMRAALTGTPVENHLGELWSIMSFLNPGLLGSSRNFDQRFARPIQRGDDLALAESLRRVVHPFILRRKKSDVLSELPEKTEVTLHIAPSPEERALYAALREQALSRLRDPGRPGEVRLRILAELMRMRRAACHPSLVVPDSNVQSSKLEAFEELVEELREEGHRALVFSQFVDHLSIVRKRLEGMGVSYQYLDGSTPPAQRAERVRAFQSGQGEVFLISLRAGGFGLNLTAADYVIHLDPWWNPAVEDQASDRAHRIGQTRPVTIYRMVMEGSIEEKILALHGEKRELADKLLEGSDSETTLSIDALTSLIKEMGPLEARESAATL
jgi:SNF2 family DNA or RNA helicase